VSVVLKNIDANDACNLLYGLPVAHRTANTALGDALMRVASAPVFANMPIPPFDRSPYDGYAFRSCDTSNASRSDPAVLKITEELPAGTPPRFEILPGTAAKILTGAPIPKGADATIKYERTEFSDSEVRVFEPIAPNTDIVRAGADIMPGDRLAYKGALITAPIISLLANQGLTHVGVFQKPLITVISTGTELCEIGTPLRPASIYNSNVHTLSAYLVGVGATPVNGSSVPDEPDIIAERIALALESSDMVITTGGASVGDYDWAVTSAERLGAEVLFWGVSLRPGGAIMAAVKDGKLILGLSGNPAAAVIGLLRVAMPFIKKLCGMAECFFPIINVALKSPLAKENPKLRILRGKLEIIDSKAYFAESGGQGSETVSSLAGCDLLGEIPMGSPPLPAGTLINAHRIML
jgi:molybdopterin molybdotransferase